MRTHAWFFSVRFISAAASATALALMLVSAVRLVGPVWASLAVALTSLGVIGVAVRAGRRPRRRTAVPAPVRTRRRRPPAHSGAWSTSNVDFSAWSGPWPASRPPAVEPDQVRYSWSPIADRRLLALYGEQRSTPDIADRMRRDADDVTTRLVQLLLRPGADLDAAAARGRERFGEMEFAYLVEAYRFGQPLTRIARAVGRSELEVGRFLIERGMLTLAMVDRR